MQDGVVKTMAESWAGFRANAHRLDLPVVAKIETVYIFDIGF